MSDCIITRRGSAKRENTIDVTNVWSTGAIAPASVYRNTSQLYNGKIYCPAHNGTEMHIYDIETDTWSTGAIAPASVSRWSSQLYNGKIYCPAHGGTAMHIYVILGKLLTIGAI